MYLLGFVFHVAKELIRVSAVPMHPQRQKHFHVLGHLVYMLTAPEAADCDKLFLDLLVPRP